LPRRIAWLRRLLQRSVCSLSIRNASGPAVLTMAVIAVQGGDWGGCRNRWPSIDGSRCRAKLDPGVRTAQKHPKSAKNRLHKSDSRPYGRPVGSVAVFLAREWSQERGNYHSTPHLCSRNRAGTDQRQIRDVRNVRDQLHLWVDCEVTGR